MIVHPERLFPFRVIIISSVLITVVVHSRIRQIHSRTAQSASPPLACVSTRTFFLLSHARSTNRHKSSTTQPQPRLVSSISVASTSTSIGEQSRIPCLGIPFAANSRINAHPFRHACRSRRCQCGSVGDKAAVEEEAAGEEEEADQEESAGER